MRDGYEDIFCGMPCRFGFGIGVVANVDVDLVVGTVLKLPFVPFIGTERAARLPADHDENTISEHLSKTWQPIRDTSSEFLRD